jgi:hypothetical protein
MAAALSPGPSRRRLHPFIVVDRGYVAAMWLIRWTGISLINRITRINHLNQRTYPAKGITTHRGRRFAGWLLMGSLGERMTWRTWFTWYGWATWELPRTGTV